MYLSFKNFSSVSVKKEFSRRYLILLIVLTLKGFYQYDLGLPNIALLPLGDILVIPFRNPLDGLISDTSFGCG